MEGEVMTIDKRIRKNNFSRSFKISVNKYDNGCMSGILYHEGEAPGICFQNLLEAILYMNGLFDEMDFPKRAMNYRQFYNTEFPRPCVRAVDEEKGGEIATFNIYVKYRFHASWQGTITWLEGQEGLEFGSFFQMICWLGQILNGSCEKKKAGIGSNIYQIAVDSYDGRLSSGSVQNAFFNYRKDFTGIIEFAETISDFMENSCMKTAEIEGQTEEFRVIRNGMWAAYRRGGKKSTFLVRIMFRQHATFQGIVYWRENGEKQTFRSFMELVLMIMSALESRGERDGGKKDIFRNDIFLRKSI